MTRGAGAAPPAAPCCCRLRGAAGGPAPSPAPLAGQPGARCRPQARWAQRRTLRRRALLPRQRWWRPWRPTRARARPAPAPGTASAQPRRSRRAAGAPPSPRAPAARTPTPRERPARGAQRPARTRRAPPHPPGRRRLQRRLGSAGPAAWRPAPRPCGTTRPGTRRWAPGASGPAAGCRWSGCCWGPRRPPGGVCPRAPAWPAPTRPGAARWPHGPRSAQPPPRACPQRRRPCRRLRAALQVTRWRAGARWRAAGWRARPAARTAPAPPPPWPWVRPCASAGRRAAAAGPGRHTPTRWARCAA
mmetsp:Transcript_15657/g.39024  ORF Transcript_15657/g.39024 Transcript_15657/m.39024 type:complete len:303 (+) Transcript_15657:900-1808(+)